MGGDGGWLTTDPGGRAGKGRAGEGGATDPEVRGRHLSPCADRGNARACGRCGGRAGNGHPEGAQVAAARRRTA